MSIRRALVVDDSKSARFSLKRLLEKEGIDVDFAESAGDALNYLASNSPDVVFMDHLMPGMDGFEATQAIKNDARTAHLPIVMCTSKEGSEYAQQAVASGAVGILPKPAPAATLTAILSQINNQGADGFSDGRSESGTGGTTAMDTIKLQSMVSRMVNDELGDLKTELLKATEVAAKTAVEAHFGKTATELRQDIKQSAEFKVKEVAHSILQKATHELVETRLTTLRETILSAVEQRLSNFEQSQQADTTDNEALLEEVKTLARFSAAAAAGETARQTAEEAASSIARSEAEHVAADISHHLESQFSRALQEIKTTSQIWAVVAAGIGVTAAILAYFFT